MNADWMLDVLADLRTFAHDNRYARLAEHLDDSLLIAAADLCNAQRSEPGEAGRHEGKAGNTHLWSGFCDNP